MSSSYGTKCDRLNYLMPFVILNFELKGKQHTLLGDVAKFTLYFTRILSELGQIHYMKSW